MSDNPLDPYGATGYAGGPPDYSARYNTQLDPEQEAHFMGQMGHRLLDLRDYDLRGAWLANAKATANGHLPDKWKKPNHPTFSDGSMYSTDQTPGGHWAEQSDGSWIFTPSRFGLSLYGAENLQRYYAQHEPGNALQWPQ